MIQTTQVIVWWIGALLILATLGYLTMVALVWLEGSVAKRVLHITRLVTVRYWVDRMEREGLTICMKEYRKMVEERKPKDLEQFMAIDRRWESKQECDQLDALKNLPPQLIAEAGMGGVVCIWRQGDSTGSARTCTVGEWLSMPENQSGTWLIDGGWGGPPGPIHVRWSESIQAWENGGYCGRAFTSEAQ